jgi:hypothetical protein
MFVAPGVSRGLRKDRNQKLRRSGILFDGEYAAPTELLDFMIDFNPGLTPWATKMPSLRD